MLMRVPLSRACLVPFLLPLVLHNQPLPSKPVVTLLLQISAKWELPGTTPPNVHGPNGAVSLSSCPPASVTGAIASSSPGLTG